MLAAVGTSMVIVMVTALGAVAATKRGRLADL
jgi:hypothetical protein